MLLWITTPLVWSLSLEDDLMRLFGSDRIANIMTRLGIEEDTPIEHGLITRAIENAQNKVEQYHFSIRKQVLEYDDVMNNSAKQFMLCAEEF